MAFNQVSERLKEVSDSLDRLMPDLIAQAVMVELMEKHKKRIFDDGLNSEGASMGKYSTKPAYYTEKQFVRTKDRKGKIFVPTGKQTKDGKKRKGNFKNGNERKSMFIATGYEGLRDIQGRKTDHVNLKYSGSLEAAIQVVKFGSSVEYGNLDALESPKFDANEERYNVMGLTNVETQFLKEEITNQAIVVAKK